MIGKVTCDAIERIGYLKRYAVSIENCGLNAAIWIRHRRRVRGRVGNLSDVTQDQ